MGSENYQPRAAEPLYEALRVAESMYPNPQHKHKATSPDRRSQNLENEKNGEVGQAS